MSCSVRREPQATTRSPAHGDARRAIDLDWRRVHRVLVGGCVGEIDHQAVASICLVESLLGGPLELLDFFDAGESLGDQQVGDTKRVRRGLVELHGVGADAAVRLVERESQLVVAYTGHGVIGPRPVAYRRRRR